MKQSNYHKPNKKMRFMLRPMSKLIVKSDEHDPTWNKNDGLVNTVSMGAPTSGRHGPEPNKMYDGMPIKGIWQKEKEIHMNHHGIIGVHLSKKKSIKIFEIYKTHCHLLCTL